MSSRQRRVTGVVVAASHLAFVSLAIGQPRLPAVVQVDYSQLVSRADLSYDKPVERSEAGLPIGNGTMGSLVWTTPTGLHFQVNRVDVYANNSATTSFFQRDSDYAFGTGFVDITLATTGADVFPEARTRQHLSLYDGLVTVEGAGVHVRVLAWQQGDAIAIEIEDQRPEPEAITAWLRMLRPPVVRTFNHVARSEFLHSGGRIVLRQVFTEGDYYCSSALALTVVGRPARPRPLGSTALGLVANPGQGKLVVLLATAASFDPKVDVVAQALQVLDRAFQAGFARILSESRHWWQEFWSQSFIFVHSKDGVGDFITENYLYFLYIVASSSRGPFPPRFGGMLWITGGDYRRWGAQHWWHNTSCYYRAIPATGHWELMEPVFRMYSGMYEACARAAEQQWGSAGIWIPETVWFDGLAPLPDDVAAEMRDLYLLRKPWELRSQRFEQFAASGHPHSSRWNWKARGQWVQGRWSYESKYNSPFGEVTHIFSTTAKIAFQYWLRYEYTLDRAWLRARAYPMLKGAAEFYRHFPNLRKGPDGLYHIHNVNDHEPMKGAQGTLEEITAMHGILPVAIRAAEILDVDPELRQAWKELLDNLLPIPTNDDPNALDPRRQDEPRIWSRGKRPWVAGDPRPKNDHLLIPVVYYDLCSVESDNEQIREISQATFDAIYPQGVKPDTPVPVLARVGIAAALLGRAREIQYLLPNQIRCLRPDRDFVDWKLTQAGVLPNRLTLREGVQAIGAQRLGRAAEALQLALLQSMPPRPAGEPVIHLFPAWPKHWDATFRLAARRGFLVTASIRQGSVRFVEIESRLGQHCRLRNPWPGREVSLYRNGQPAESLKGSLLEFRTQRGERLLLIPAGTRPEDVSERIP